MDADVDAEIARTRQTNERWLSAFLAIFAGAFTLLNAGQLLGGSTELGTVSVMGVALLYAVYYGLVWLRVETQSPTASELAVRTVLEVSVPVWVTLVDAQLGADYALPRVSVLIWSMAIFVSVLRLRPDLSLLAGVVAGAEWLAIWLWLAPMATPDLPSAAAGPAVNRAGLLLACGILAWRIAGMQEALTRNSVRTALERARVRRAFGAYLPEPIVQRILDGDLRLSSERRPVTVMFVDIRSFTRFAEGMEPDEVLGILNRTLEAFSQEVRNGGGFVNKYLGDGLMAIFGAPAQQKEHAAAAVQAAVAIAQVADELARTGVYPGLRIGVGLHCGDVVVGDVGGEEYREYTAIGDVVNVASRVEAQTKVFHTTVLATEAVRQAAGGVAEFQDLGAVTLHGRSEPVKLWAVRGMRTSASLDTEIQAP